MQPKIKIEFDKELDKEIAWNFYNEKEIAGCNFWKERALKYHPKLLKINSIKNFKEKKDFLEKYIDNFYLAKKEELEILKQKTIENLKFSQKDFFNVVSEIFNSYPWSRKEYFGYLSIFDFCPRFLDFGGFQIFIYDNKKMQLFTVFHEMLHFIFYDFAKNNFPEKLGKLETEEGLFWELAEVFNAVVQNTDNFIKIHGKINGIGYPDHKEMILKGSKIWKENQDVKFWIEEMMS